MSLMKETIFHESKVDQASPNVDINTWLGLDSPEEWGRFSREDSSQEYRWESHLVIEGMHCAACAINLENILTSINGVISASVNSASGRATLTWSSLLTKPSDWMMPVVKAGYQISPASDIWNQDLRRKEQRKALWRMLVAGLCMMQVMMYSYPLYIANPGDMTPDNLNLMRWASWLLTLPVILFSCGPFFKNALNDLKQRQISMDLPVSLGILITFIVSTAVTFQPSSWWGHEVYFDSLTMFVFFLLTGRWIELRMRDRTAGALDVLMRRIPPTVERINEDGSVERVVIRRLAVGEELRIFPGETFPVDGTITLGNTSADEALLTGESHPVRKNTGDEVIAGSYNLSATVQVRVNKIGEATRYAQIVALMERASVEKPRLALLADCIARPFLIAVLLASAATAALLWQADHNHALMAAVAVLIVTCPCALSLATPAAMLTTSGALARSGILVRRIQALEALTNIDTIVFDKTGTLTHDKMKVGKIDTGRQFTQSEVIQIAANIARFSLHPISRALAEMSPQIALADPKYQIHDVQEIAGAGLIAESNFGLGQLKPGQLKLGQFKPGQLKLGSAEFCGLENRLTDQFAGSGLMVHLVSETSRIASFEIIEAIKPEAIPVIQSLLQAGIQVEILSGDGAQSVERIAKICGIDYFRGHCTPQDKLAHLHALQKQGHRTAMVGDGLNDGPVLASADVSIAMGQAVPLAQAQSDFVVLSGNLSMVPHMIMQAKRTMRVVKQNLIWAAAYNAVCVPIAVMGFLPAWLAGLGMAISSLMVILNAARLSNTPLMNNPINISANSPADMAIN